MPSHNEQPFLQTVLTAARDILGLFTQETELKEIANGILDILVRLDLIENGLIIFPGDGPPTLACRHPESPALLSLEPFELLRKFSPGRDQVSGLAADRNPLGPTPGIAIALAGASFLHGLLLACPGEIGRRLQNEHWLEIGCSAGWILDRAASCARLESSHARYQRLFERSRDFLFVVDHSGQWLEINPAGVSLLGYSSRSEMSLTTTLADIFLHPHDYERLLELAAVRNNVTRFETTLRRKDGEPVHAVITLAHWDEGPGRSGLEGVIRDVTKLRRSLDDLILCRSTTEGIIEGSPVGIFVLDSQHRVTHWNKACETLTGIKREDVLGTGGHQRVFRDGRSETMGDLLLDGDIDRLQLLYGDRNLHPSPMVPGGWEAEDRCFSLKGDPRNLYVSAAPFLAPDGALQGAVQVLWDVSDRIRLEEDLKASENSFRQIIRQAWDGIVIHDSQAVYFANSSFRKMFEIRDDEELAGAYLHRFLAHDTRRGLFEAFRLPESSEHKTFSFEGRGMRPDGTWFDIELSTARTTWKGRPVLQTVLRDITERKHMEEQLVLSERLAATGTLALNIAHEINNPLGGIITYIHLLMEDIEACGDRAQIHDTAAKILKLGNRCKIIVSGLLDFARPDDRGREIVHLNHVVTDTLVLLQGHIIMRDIEVVQSLEPSLPPIMAQRNKIEQVFMNLIINAAESMKNSGRLTIKSVNRMSDGEVDVLISDTGPGITPEDRKRLFEPFFSTKPRGRGTGLGLAISHGIIKQHHGHISVESQPGVGTTFTITLPTSGRGPMFS